MNKIIAWWSGGITSAVSIDLVIQQFGKEKVEVYFIDTKNEHPDTYRFLKDCEKLYGLEIKTLTNEKYNSIEDVWIKYKSLNVVAVLLL